MIEPYKSKVITNLKKAQGQIKYVLKMIEEGKYCMDVASQTNAAIGLLKKANENVLESHLSTCGMKNLANENETERAQFIKDIVRAFTLNNK